VGRLESCADFVVAAKEDCLWAKLGRDQFPCRRNNLRALAAQVSAFGQPARRTVMDDLDNQAEDRNEDRRSEHSGKPGRHGRIVTTSSDRPVERFIASLRERSGPLTEPGYPGLVSVDLERLGRRLVGAWTTEATHPEVPGTIVGGTAEVQWLEGERFLVFRSHNDHPDFPDSTSIIGDTDGLQWHYFDSRGVHRILEMRVTDDGWEIARDATGRDAPESGRDAPEFSQRLMVTFEDDDNSMAGLAKLSYDGMTWQDDLRITYRRSQ
jgi:hypothetical protein